MVPAVLTTTNECEQTFVFRMFYIPIELFTNSWGAIFDVYRILCREIYPAVGSHWGKSVNWILNFHFYQNERHLQVILAHQWIFKDFQESLVRVQNEVVLAFGYESRHLLSPLQFGNSVAGSSHKSRDYTLGLESKLILWILNSIPWFFVLKSFIDIQSTLSCSIRITVDGYLIPCHEICSTLALLMDHVIFLPIDESWQISRVLNSISRFFVLKILIDIQSSFS